VKGFCEHGNEPSGNFWVAELLAASPGHSSMEVAEGGGVDLCVSIESVVLLQYLQCPTSTTLVTFAWSRNGEPGNEVTHT
jgi:hypothetical protein